jgi:hypothetical protein
MGGAANMGVFALDGVGLALKVAVVTDGQMSGLANKGLVVAEVEPEGGVTGPLSVRQTAISSRSIWRGGASISRFRKRNFGRASRTRRLSPNRRAAGCPFIAVRRSRCRKERRGLPRSRNGIECHD